MSESRNACLQLDPSFKNQVGFSDNRFYDNTSKLLCQLVKRDAKTRIQQSLQDTSDIVLSAVELDFGSQQSDMAHKITIDKKMRPYSRGPLAAATKNLHMNSGYKVKYPNGQSQKPAVKPLSPQQGSVSAGLSMLTTGSKKRLSNSPR